MNEVEKTAQNENSVLDSLNDAYINKKRRIKKSIYSVILSVIFALATIIIVMSSIRVDLKPSFVVDPELYTVCIAGKEKVYEQSNQKFEEFHQIYEDAFNVSYLTALFTGKLGGYKPVEDINSKFYYTESTKTGMHSDLSKALGNNYIKLSYANQLQIKNADGSVYYSDYNTTCDLTFEDVYFPLNTEDKDADLTFFFGTTGIGMGYTITKITVRANTFALYEFASENLN